MNDFNSPHNHKRRELPTSGNRRADTPAPVENQPHDRPGSGAVSLVVTLVLVLALALIGLSLLGVL